MAKEREGDIERERVCVKEREGGEIGEREREREGGRKLYREMEQRTQRENQKVRDDKYKREIDRWLTYICIYRYIYRVIYIQRIV